MNNICLSCKSKKITSKKSFKNLKLVSSDTLPVNYKFPTINICNSCGLIQKKITQTYLKNIRNIYKNYKTFHQEKKKIGQSIFNSKGISLSRSKIIFKYLFSKIKKNYKNYKVLDYGCGSGINMIHLRNFIKQKNIFGYEKYFRKSTIIHKSLLKKIYNEKIFKDTNKFDLIISIFILEHVLDPNIYFKNISKLLTDDGLLLLQVPDIKNNPYDFTIYDHIFHFSKETLINTLKEHDFEILYISNKIVEKEITCIVRKNKRKKNLKKLEFLDKSYQIVKNSQKYLNSNIKLCNNLLNKYEKIVILGSSISAIWVFNNFKNYVFGFVDEDKNRIGKRIEKILIHDLYDNNISKYPILIPLMPKIAKYISKRHQKINFYYIKK